SKGYPTARTNHEPAGIHGFGALAGEITSDRIYRMIISIFTYLFICLFIFILSSPQNFLNWNDFVSSMNYESAVGLGTYIPFYTRQFVGNIPLLFQFQKILPFVLGWPQLILAVAGFFFLPSHIRGIIKRRILWLCADDALFKHSNYHRASSSASKDIKYGAVKNGVLTESAILIDLLRFSLFLSFVPSSFLFAKWTRFVSPSFPLFSLFALLFLLQLFQNKTQVLRFVRYIVLLVAIIPGIAYLSIYLSPDVRFVASEWMYKNIPNGSKILSETANVVDIPILPITSRRLPLSPPIYLINSFNFYDIDSTPQLQADLSQALNQADYIIIPSRRIFKNHSKDTYPVLMNYYEDLFSGRTGLKKVAEFSSYPKITLFGKMFIEFPDEEAEETWTVFDHPVIRIYKKVQNSNSKFKSKLFDFSNYQTINYQLPASHFSPATNYSLLIADTPEKWEKGLMYVKNKEDIGGRDGMLFTFPDSQQRSFWNKNTLSHLSLYWIQENKVVGFSNLPSITETGVITTVFSPSLADTVIEIIK
ncbi:MAG: DUF192 domain-containing protein, partial [bacterium]